MEDSDFKTMVMSAVNKLLAQGEASMEGFYNGCMYRSPRGLCCIIGFMMDDKTAKKADDLGESTVEYVIRDGVWGKDLSNAQVNQLVKLQECHDTVHHNKPFNEEFIKGVNAKRDLLWVAQYIGARG
jgi:hypothetical protein